MKTQKPCGEQNLFLHPFKHLSLFVFLAVSFNLFAQTDSLMGFNRIGALRHASYAITETQKEKILQASERAYIKQRFFSSKENPVSENPIYARQTAANCDNIGFENANTSGWKVTGDYKIVSAGNDPFGNFPKVFPGGKYSLQLNDNNVNNKVNFNASATKVFDVTSTNNSVNLRFAMVILNFPHDSASAARFKITLRDSTNHVTLCSQFNCYYEIPKGAIGSNNFTTSSVQGTNIGDEHFPVTYAPWETIGIDLTAHTGKKIALQISCDWCVFSYDWAYCYIDADCGGFISTEYPCAKQPKQLNGPPGYQIYKWTVPGGKVVAGNSSSVALQGSGTYTLRCSQAANCPELPFTYLYTIKEANKPKFDIVTNPCSLTVTLTVSDVVPGAAYTWKWQDSAYYTTTSANVKHIYRYGGIQDIDLEIKTKEACVASSRLTFTLSAPVDVRAQTNDLKAKFYGPDDKRPYEAFTRYNGYLNYTWTSDNFYEKGQYTEIGEDGIYILEAIDPQTGCKDTAIINVILNGRIPNIFTPNGDGANDLFRFRTKKGMILSIVDRWGHLVFNSEDNHGVMSWDGRHEGNNCADGIFMYVIKAVEPKPDEKAISGTVTLLR